MKLTIKTSLLKDLLSKVDKCATKNKMLPLTGMMRVSVKDNLLTLTTTDGSNYLYVTNVLQNEDFYAVVDEDVFVKLVSKTTSDTMTFELIDNHLEVKGNGKYSVELPIDENGQLIIYPDPVAKFVHKDTVKLSHETIELILRTNKSALSTSLAEPCYTGYYIGDRVITSDRSVICCNDLKLFDSPKLINPELMNLLSVFTKDIVAIFSDNNEVMFTDMQHIAYGHLMSDIDEYNAEAVIKLVDTDMPYTCDVNRNTLLNSLDRLSLFVSTYDKNAITLKFTNEYLEITNVNSNAVERIKYAYLTNTSDASYSVDIEMLEKQLSVQSGDTVEIGYGNDIFLKLVDGDTTQLIPLLVE